MKSLSLEKRAARVRRAALATAAVGLVLVSTLPLVATAATMPCEDMLKDLRDAEASVSADGATKDKVAALEAKGIERCNADDDARADDFFAQALKLLGK